MRIVDITIEHALHIVNNMREVDVREICASRRNDDLIEFAHECVALGGWVALTIDGEPAIMGGFAMVWDDMANAWMVGTDRAGECIITATRFARKAMVLMGFKRYQAFSACFHTQSHEWLEYLGFAKAHTMKYWGRGGADFYLFERIIGE